MSRDRADGTVVVPSESPGAIKSSVDEILAEAAGRLRRDRQTRRRLPGGGRLFVDGVTPFLTVYRQPGERADPGTFRIPTSLRSYLVMPAGQSVLTRRICAELTEVMVELFGAALLVEIWAAGRFEPRGSPRLDLHVRHGQDGLVEAFTRALEGLQVVPPDEAAEGEGLASVRVVEQARAAPPDEVPILPDPGPAGQRVQWIGIGIPAWLYAEGWDDVLPERLAFLRRGLASALESAIWSWATGRRLPLPKQQRSFGRRSLGRTARAIDTRLAEIAASFDLLLGASPVNHLTMWRSFEASRRERPPRFQYAPLSFDPESLKKSLFQVPLERIEDPLVAELIREKQEELDVRITMLRNRGRPEFFLGSLQLFGQPEEPLVEMARNVLKRVASGTEHPDDVGCDRSGDLDARAFVHRAKAEMDAYIALDPAFPKEVEIRDDISAGLLVSGGRLCVSRHLCLPLTRVEALLHHEVGTHVLTFFNGSRQPLRLLATGLAHYGALQEGLAVLAEYLAGGLSRTRARTLAARVVAVHARVDGADFVTAFRHLVEHGIAPRHAFSIVVRVYRGGGLTKDFLYLQGLHDVLRYLHEGGSLDVLLLGKIGLSHIDIVRELAERGLLVAPAVRPRYLRDEECARRLQDLPGSDVVHLLTERAA